MSEFSHQEGDPTFRISFAGGEGVVNRRRHRRNTFIYNFERHSEGDHIFIAGKTKGDNVTGAFIFKKEVIEKHDAETYHKIVNELGKIGCLTFQTEFMGASDQSVFRNHFGRLPEENPIIIPEHELTPRQENVIGYLGYLFEQNYIMPIIFKHGTTAVSNGSTAARESKDNPEVNVVRGHTHRTETFYRTTRAGNYLASVIVGALCRTTGEVPSYHSAVDDDGHVVPNQENWQQSVLVIEDYNGSYQFNHIPIRDGKAQYMGTEYEA